jgi:flavin reductase (DIM6/NTAB) family NADH-FMN oxidoreductase RutF
MECLLEQAIPLGGSVGEPACDLLIGRVVRFHISDEIYEDGYINARKLGPVSRMAGSFYSRLGELFAIDRPE